MDQVTRQPDVADLEALLSGAARRLKCAGHSETIGEARRPGYSGRFLKQVVADPELFLRECWDRRVVRSAGVVPDGLFSSADGDRLLSYGGLRVPEVRMVKDRGSVPNEAYMSDRALGYSRVSGVIDHDRVDRLVEQGATLLFQGVRRFWEPIDVFAAGLEGDLGVPIQATVFSTPANGSGIPKHHDLHSVFVMQLEGSRRWTYGATAAGHRPSAHVDPQSIRDADLTGETVLEQGDCLYIPRGTPHLAHVVPGRSSLHLTLSLRDAPTVADVTGALIGALIDDDPIWDRTIPAPADPADRQLGELLGQCLEQTIAKLSRLTPAELAELGRRAAVRTLSPGEQA
jgi:ribosomal protein L16 Arg81 hydroxylase